MSSFEYQFVEFLLAAGAVPFVKTNIGQLLMSFESSNPLWGVTTNPYNKNFSPSGSSGGEACMLALDASVIGIGGDFAGSLRSPALACGIYSLKPTHGRISAYGASGLHLVIQ
jgi:amidase